MGDVLKRLSAHPLIEIPAIVQPFDLSQFLFGVSKKIDAFAVERMAEQKLKGKAERNDRLFAVPRRSHSEQGLHDVRDLSKPIQQELEKFFIATDELEDKKLEIIGWKGPKTAIKLIESAEKAAKEKSA